MAKADTCPICKRPSAREFKPFCSARCKDRDLLKWLGDGYAIPGEPIDPEALDMPETGD